MDSDVQCSGGPSRTCPCGVVFTPAKHNPGQRFCCTRCRQRVWETERYAADAGFRDKKSRRNREYYSRGYWAVKRRKELAAQRGRVLAELDALGGT